MDYSVLVLSGGAYKGIGILGSLDYLYTNKKLDNITTYIGTSVGSMICYLLIIGYRPEEIFTHICTNDILPEFNNELTDICMPILPTILKGIIDKTKILKNIELLLQNILQKGCIQYDKITKLLEKLTINKLLFIPTMKELYYLFNKEFICCSYKYLDSKEKDSKENDSNNGLEYISYKNYPDLSCLDAIRMSSNIPLIFGEFKYNGYKYIDGGFVNNFSVDFKTDKNIIGISVLGNNLVNNNSPFMSIIGLLYLPIYLREKEKIKEKKNSTIIRLIIDEISHTSSITDKIKYYNDGKNQTRKKFEKLKID